MAQGTAEGAAQCGAEGAATGAEYEVWPKEEFKALPEAEYKGRRGQAAVRFCLQVTSCGLLLSLLWMRQLSRPLSLLYIYMYTDALTDALTEAPTESPADAPNHTDFWKKISSGITWDLACSLPDFGGSHAVDPSCFLGAWVRIPAHFRFWG